MIDPEQELTPPPQEPPQPATIRGYETLDEAVRAQLDTLATGLGQATEAIGKLWDTRKDARRLDQIDSKLATLAKYATQHQTILDQYAIPHLKQISGSFDGISRDLSRLSTSVEAMTITITALDNRVRTLEGELRVTTERLSVAQQATAERLASAELARSSLAARVAELEQIERDRVVTAKALSKVERRRAGGLAGLIAAAVSAIAAAVANLVK